MSEMIKCAHCGVEMPRFRDGTKFCSKACGAKYRYHHRKPGTYLGGREYEQRRTNPDRGRLGVSAINHVTHGDGIRYLVVTREAQTEHDNWEEAKVEYEIRTARGAA